MSLRQLVLGALVDPDEDDEWDDEEDEWDDEEDDEDETSSKHTVETSEGA